jgi:hypothetical protein
LPVTTVTVTVEPSLVALTNTPSMAFSSAELTRPVSAGPCVCAGAAPESSMANAELAATKR